MYGRITDSDRRRPTMSAFRTAALLLLVALGMDCALAQATAPTAIHLANGYAIERDGISPPPPPDLLLAEGALSGTHYYVVQCTGPLQHDWLVELARHDARTIGYLPRYAVVAKMSSERIAELESLDFVAWITPFQPVCKLEDRVLGLDRRGPLLVVPFPEHDVDSLADVVTRLGIRVSKVAGRAITIEADRAEVALVAGLDAVEWVQLDDRAVAFNSNVQWVMQTGWQPAIPPDSTGRRIWHEGIRGQNMVLSISDLGLNVDHDMFFDPLVPIRDPGIYLHHRKVIAYRMYGNSNFGDYPDSINAPPWHGTRVCCTAVGNDSVNGNASPLDGVAPDARIYFVDIGDRGGNYVVLADDLPALLDSLYLARGTGMTVPQTSLSWGWHINPRSGYDQKEAYVDAANWRYPELLTICAAGNDDNSIAHPACAKNVLTVGGCGNCTLANGFHEGLGRGPTRDGRTKPDLVAPAVNVWSAVGPGFADYRTGTGTSLSTPAVNGACALIRQYLNEGWYPTGVPDASHRIMHPSSALLRAMAVVSTDPNVGARVVPDSFIGWGRIDLDSVLYFAGDRRKLWLVDDASGLATGEFRYYTVNVVDSEIPLRACLAWTDTAAMPDAETTLVNDLDLVLFSPSSQRFSGNQYYGGQSSLNPHDTDRVSNIECFRLNRANTGVWHVLVIAHNVFTRRQPFALVFTGGCDSLLGIADYPLPSPQPSVQLFRNPTTGPALLLCVLPWSEPVTAAAFDQSGRLVRSLRRTQLPAGSHLLRWDLLDQQGVPVNPGVYFLRLDIGGTNFTRKLVIAR
jgi:subtilisin family serine protease